MNMSAALKCNRCKRCFDVEDEKIGQWITINAIRVHDAEHYKEGTFVNRIEWTDLCPSCAEEFKRWLDRDLDEEKEIKIPDFGDLWDPIFRFVNGGDTDGD